MILPLPLNALVSHRIGLIYQHLQIDTVGVTLEQMIRLQTCGVGLVLLTDRTHTLNQIIWIHTGVQIIHLLVLLLAMHHLGLSRRIRWYSQHYMDMVLLAVHTHSLIETPPFMVHTLVQIIQPLVIFLAVRIHHLGLSQHIISCNQ